MRYDSSSEIDCLIYFFSFLAMGFYAQETDKFAYYNHITAVAEETLPGCSKAVKSTLSEVQNSILQRQGIEDLKAIASEVGICPVCRPKCHLTEKRTSTAICNSRPWHHLSKFCISEL